MTETPEQMHARLMRIALIENIVIYCVIAGVTIFGFYIGTAKGLWSLLLLGFVNNYRFKVGK